MVTEEVKQATVIFEALKSRMYQNKDGHYLTLKIHRNDIPEELIRDDINCRYYVTVTPIGDDEKPAPHRERSEGEFLVAEVGRLTKDKNFQEFLVETNRLSEEDFLNDDYEEVTANFLRNHLNVVSRAELKGNILAQESWQTLRGEYDEWKYNIS
tara:strand:+ start:401 stop:865 length:465 start_codon:yes stop_codon:yes gene_type:complete